MDEESLGADGYTNPEAALLQMLQRQSTRGACPPLVEAPAGMNGHSPAAAAATDSAEASIDSAAATAAVGSHQEFRRHPRFDKTIAGSANIARTFTRRRWVAARFAALDMVDAEEGSLRWGGHVPDVEPILRPRGTLQLSPEKVVDALKKIEGECETAELVWNKNRASALKQLNKPGLVEELQTLQLGTTGTKPVLLERLREALMESDPDWPPPATKVTRGGAVEAYLGRWDGGGAHDFDVTKYALSLFASQEDIARSLSNGIPMTASVGQGVACLAAVGVSTLLGTLLAPTQLGLHLSVMDTGPVITTGSLLAALPSVLPAELLHVVETAEAAYATADRDLLVRIKQLREELPHGDRPLKHMPLSGASEEAIQAMDAAYVLAVESHFDAAEKNKDRRRTAFVLSYTIEILTTHLAHLAFATGFIPDRFHPSEVLETDMFSKMVSKVEGFGFLSADVAAKMRFAVTSWNDKVTKWAALKKVNRAMGMSNARKGARDAMKDV